MQHDQKQLHQIAQDYPWHTFTVEEIAVLCNVSRDVVTRVRMANDSPFFLNKCRPEWFLQWMREHPDFALTKDYVPAQNSITVEVPAKNLSGVTALKRTKKRRAKNLAVA